VDLLKRIETIIEEPLQARGYTLVRVQLSGGIRKVLQIMIERIDEVAITVDDCTTVSRLVSVLLDVQDPIKDPYTLEVSSPGLERPLVKLRDYQRFCGQMVLLTTHQPVNGRKRFQGRLTSAGENGITLDLLDVPGEALTPVSIELENIRAARLFIDFEAL
jgi:ribosome maturation factor RimP